MNRRDLIKGMGATAVAASMGGLSSSKTHAQDYAAGSAPNRHTGGAHAITMWDFSWIERGWPGASYENWDQALDELTDLIRRSSPARPLKTESR